MAVYHQADGPRIYRYFTGNGVWFLSPHDIIRLRLHKKDPERAWAIHDQGGFHTLHRPEDRAWLQVLDLLFKRDELDEFTMEGAPLEKVHPELDIPEFTT